MFNIVEKHQKTVKGIMITLAATFVLWGVSGYFGMGGDGRLGGLWKMKFEVVGDAGGSGFRWKENP